MNKPSVTLRDNGRLISEAIYRIEKLLGTAKVQLHNPCPASTIKSWRVGDSVSAEVADKLCQEGNYQVTILAAEPHR